MRNVVIEKNTVWDKAGGGRRVLPCFLARGMRGSEMPHLVAWIVAQCGTPETECRKQCMGLFVQLAPLQQGIQVMWDTC